jgi:hypothetical protein
MLRLAVAFVALCVVVSSASAQIIYEPVRYQYGSGNTVYYYGGSDPAMFRYAKHDVNVNPHQIVEEPLRVYSDSLPRRNAAVFGYLPSDAHNDANRNLPGYYRKVDLLRSGHIDATGAYIVPANAPNNVHGMIEIRPYTTTRPTTAPHPVIIIPKDLLDKPLKPQDGQKLVSAHA